MRVFNLSDATPPYKPARRARILKIKGVMIKPGESGEVPDTVPASEFSGLIVSNMVSVDVIPDWYSRAKEEAAKAEAKKAEAEKETEEPVIEIDSSDAVAEEEVEPEPEGLEEPRKPKKRRKRG